MANESDTFSALLVRFGNSGRGGMYSATLRNTHAIQHRKLTQFILQ